MAYNFDIKSGEYINQDDNAYAVTDISSDHNQSKGDCLSVSDALLIAKTGLESIKVKILGEISEISNKSGYKAVYFTIKDKKSALPCLMWKNRFLACDIDINVGSLVEVTGRFSLYIAKGRMNFDVENISLAGEGELRMQVARLAKKLQQSGLTDISKKKSIPDMPKKIGLITSPRGAVVHDVLRTLKRRMPIANVVFAGVPVEGVNAPKDMISALNCLEKTDVDVVLLVRGGGSFEDLMPFNDEDLAYRISSYKIPIVTGIGHEPDTTIADLVSDFRASTPTGAAEAVSVNLNDLIEDYYNKFQSINKNFLNRIHLSKDQINSISSRRIFADASQLYANEFQNIDYLQETLYKLLDKSCVMYKQELKFSYNKLYSNLKIFLNAYKNDISVFAAKLQDKSPLTILSRGYCVTKNSNNHIVKSVNQINKNDNLNILVSDGKISCKVEDINKTDKLI